MKSCSESTLLGDRVSEALAKIGITDESVSHWLNAPCGCNERRERLNAIDAWARRVLSGYMNRAREFLNRIISIE